MIFLANRANLDTRTLLTRLHNRLQTQVSSEASPVTQVWYHTSTGNKIGVRATITPNRFLNESYPTSECELQVSFDFPKTKGYDFYTIQWVDPERNFMIGWHQDETHMDLGKCHFQMDHQGDTVQRNQATFLDSHPLNVFEQRIDELVDILDELTWRDGVPTLPHDAV